MKRLSMLMLISTLATSAMASLPIITDDYAKARAEAQRRKVPIFVEVWAPW
jgi:hypothetical protein